MLKHRSSVAWVLLIGALACSRGTPPSPSPSKSGALAEQPRLVVLIIVDQLGAWVWDRYRPLLPEDGALRRAVARGASLTVAYPYANTATAPGHATLATGVTPALHGVVANKVYDPALGARQMVDDRRHAVIGSHGRYAGPAVLRAPTVAELLHEHSGGKARIAALSMKARSAVFSVGKQADAVTFFDPNVGGFTTSTFYAPDGALPKWVTELNARHPAEQRVSTWRPSDPSWLRKHLGPDEGPGEGQILGWDNTFPYDPHETLLPLEAFAFTPQSTELLFDAAWAAVEGLNMGRDESPDLLVLSVSGTDFVGHVWGPSSWEYADNLLRTDQALAAFLKRLEALGPVAIVLSADHGVAPLPESLQSRGESAGRLKASELTRRAETVADRALGEGDWIAGYVAPLLSYTDQGRARREALSRALVKELPELDAIYRAYDAWDVLPQGGGDRVDELVRASLPGDPPGDLYLVTRPHWFDELSQTPNRGTNHGSPWPYDRRVPVLMWGAGIGRFSSEEVFDARKVATTVATLLGIPAPPDAPKTALPGLALDSP